MIVKAIVLLAAVTVVLLILPGTTPATSVNDGFDPNVSGPVRSLAVQADGTVLVGGYFTSTLWATEILLNISGSDIEPSGSDTFGDTLAHGGVSLLEFTPYPLTWEVMQFDRKRSRQ